MFYNNLHAWMVCIHQEAPHQSEVQMFMQSNCKKGEELVPVFLKHAMDLQKIMYRISTVTVLCRSVVQESLGMAPSCLCHNIN